MEAICITPLSNPITPVRICILVSNKIVNLRFIILMFKHTITIVLVAITGEQITIQTRIIQSIPWLRGIRVSIILLIVIIKVMELYQRVRPQL